MSEWAQFEDKVEAKGYAQISNALLRSPHISLQAKGFYALLKSYAWQDPTSFPGVKRLCADTGASDNTLKKYRDELIEAGLLEVKRRGRGKTNIYIFKSISTYLESHTGAKQESHTGSVLESHPGANNEDSVIQDAVDKDSVSPTECEETSQQASRTQSQNLTDEFYRAIQERYKIRLKKEQYEFHLGNFSRMLKQYAPTEEELERVVVHMVERYAAAPRIEALTAIQDVRLSRDKRAEENVWDKPADWEPINPHSEKGATLRDKPRKDFWYLSAYQHLPVGQLDELLRECETHSEIVAAIEGLRVAV